MGSVRVVLATFIVVLATVAIGGSAVPDGAAESGVVPAATPTSTPGDGEARANESTSGTVANATNASLGSHLSSFMQSNAARTAESVENGMWVASYENASNATRESLIRSRSGSLERRIDDLRDRKRSLRDARENGTIGAVAYRAALSQVMGRLAALTEAIDETDRRAGAAGVRATELDELRRRADEITGPEMREIARGLRGPDQSRRQGPPDEDRGGPPSDAGNASERGGSGNRSTDAGPPENGSGGDGPRKGHGESRGNESNAGGSGDGNDEGNGSGGEAGQGDGNGGDESGSGEGNGNESGNGDGKGGNGAGTGNGGKGGSDDGAGDGGGDGNDEGSGSGGGEGTGKGGDGNDDGKGGSDDGAGDGGGGDGKGKDGNGRGNGNSEGGDGIRHPGDGPSPEGN